MQKKLPTPPQANLDKPTRLKLGTLAKPFKYLSKRFGRAAMVLRNTPQPPLQGDSPSNSDDSSEGHNTFNPPIVSSDDSPQEVVLPVLPPTPQVPPVSLPDHSIEGTSVQTFLHEVSPSTPNGNLQVEQPPADEHAESVAEIRLSNCGEIDPPHDTAVPLPTETIDSGALSPTEPIVPIVPMDNQGVNDNLIETQAINDAASVKSLVPTEIIQDEPGIDDFEYPPSQFISSPFVRSKTEPSLFQPFYSTPRPRSLSSDGLLQGAVRNDKRRITNTTNRTNPPTDGSPSARREVNDIENVAIDQPSARGRNRTFSKDTAEVLLLKASNSRITSVLPRPWSHILRGITKLDFHVPYSIIECCILLQECKALDDVKLMLASLTGISDVFPVHMNQLRSLTITASVDPSPLLTLLKIRRQSEPKIKIHIDLSSCDKIPLRVMASLNTLLVDSERYLDELSLIDVLPKESELQTLLYRRAHERGLWKLVIRNSSSATALAKQHGLIDRQIGEETLQALTLSQGGTPIARNLEILELSPCNTADGVMAKMLRSRRKDDQWNLTNFACSFADSPLLHVADRTALEELQEIPRFPPAARLAMNRLFRYEYILTDTLFGPAAAHVSENQAGA